MEAIKDKSTMWHGKSDDLGMGGDFKEFNEASLESMNASLSGC